MEIAARRLQQFVDDAADRIAAVGVVAIVELERCAAPATDAISARAVGVDALQ
jgi:DNA-binding ferritin-like protein